MLREVQGSAVIWLSNANRRCCTKAAPRWILRVQCRMQMQEDALEIGAGSGMLEAVHTPTTTVLSAAFAGIAGACA